MGSDVWPGHILGGDSMFFCIHVLCGFDVCILFFSVRMSLFFIFFYCLPYSLFLFRPLVHTNASFCPRVFLAVFNLEILACMAVPASLGSSDLT